MVRKKKILEVIRVAEGGMKTHFISLCIGLKEAGYDVVALCDAEEMDRELLASRGVKVYPFKLTGNISLVKDLMSVIKVCKIVGKEKVDIIHCHGFKASLISRMAALFVKLPCIYTVHNFALDNGNPIQRFFIRNVEKAFSVFTNRIIAVSEALKTYMINKAGIMEDKIHVIYNGIQLKKYVCDSNGDSIRKKYNLDDSKIIIGTVARLIPSKGIEYLLRAIPSLNKMRQDLVFFIIGKGPLEQKLKDISKNLGIDHNTIFTGYVDNIEEYYKAIDIFILPTLSEGLGISLLEAMASKKPIIAAETGGIPEIIKDGENGILIRPHSSEDIVNAVLCLLDNLHLAKVLANRAYNDVQLLFSEKTMINRTCEVIRLITQYR